MAVTVPKKMNPSIHQNCFGDDYWPAKDKGKPDQLSGENKKVFLADSHSNLYLAYNFQQWWFIFQNAKDTLQEAIWKVGVTHT